MSASNYRDVNYANWQERVPLHAASAEYGLDRFRNDPLHLSDVVRFDLPRLGEISGLDVVHLQCHIGTDTLSLARLGARVTGLDFSDAAIEVARSLSGEAGPHVDYVVSDVYDAPATLGSTRFDRVYTGIGALCWLPDIRRWAQVVAELLRPGGELFIREGHPMLWAADDPRDDGLITIEYPYFETTGTPFSDTKTYVEHDGEIQATGIISFNHALSEIFNALWDSGMQITMFDEHDSVPWKAQGDLMHEIGGGEFRLIERPERMPMSYTLRATRT